MLKLYCTLCYTALEKQIFTTLSFKAVALQSDILTVIPIQELAKPLLRSTKIFGAHDQKNLIPVYIFKFSNVFFITSSYLLNLHTPPRYPATLYWPSLSSWTKFLQHFTFIECENISNLDATNQNGLTFTMGALKWPHSTILCRAVSQIAVSFRYSRFPVIVVNIIAIYGIKDRARKITKTPLINHIYWIFKRFNFQTGTTADEGKF